MLALGGIQQQLIGQGKAIDRIHADMSEERDHAHDSRTTIHKRLDEQAQQISHLETTVAIRGQVEAQLRDQIASITAEVSPAISEWRRIKILGAGFGGVLLILGISIGSIMAWASDTAV